jgi:hypothetical protein
VAVGRGARVREGDMSQQSIADPAPLSLPLDPRQVKRRA